MRRRDGEGTVLVFYSDAYVSGGPAFDTTRKAPLDQTAGAGRSATARAISCAAASVPQRLVLITR